MVETNGKYYMSGDGPKSKAAKKAKAAERSEPTDDGGTAFGGSGTHRGLCPMVGIKCVVAEIESQSRVSDSNAGENARRTPVMSRTKDRKGMRDEEKTGIGALWQELAQRETKLEELEHIIHCCSR